MKKRIALSVVGLLFIVFISVLVFGPNYAKSYVEDHSLELVGRQIKIEELDFNAFNGHFLITDFRLLENESEEVFVQFDTLYSDLTLYKLFGGTFLTEALHIKGLDINVWMENEGFNFDDLIPAEDTNAVEVTSEEESFIHIFTLNDIQILNSDVKYEDRDLQTDHNLKDINIRVPGITFGDKETKAGLEFELAKGGRFSMDVDYNIEENSYECNMGVSQLDLSPYLKYAQSSMNISGLEGWFSGDVRIIGDLDEPTTPLVSGSMNVNDFSLIDNRGIKAVHVGSASMNAKKLDLKTYDFHFGLLQLTRPEINAVQYAEFDNLRTLMKEDSDSNKTEMDSNQTVADGPVVQYLLEEFRLINGEMNYTDESIANGPFSYSISEIQFSADSLTEGRDVTFNMGALMNGTGKLKGLVITDPGNPSKGGTFDLDLKDVPIEDFSVFSMNSTAYPINGGRLAFQTKNTVVNNHLNSHLIIQLYQTDLAKKRKDIKPEYNVPLKLGVMVLEDPKKLIKIDVPAEGDIDDPEFRYSKLIWKVVMNVLVKAATSPYSALAEAVGGNEDDIKFIRFELIQWELGPEQTHQVDMISEVLAQKPDISVSATQVLDVEKEKKLITDYLAKKGLFVQKKYGSDTVKVVLDEVDRAKVLHMEEDTELITFLEGKTKSVSGSLKYNELVGLYVQQQEVDDIQIQIMKLRVENLRTYITEKGVTERFIIRENHTVDPNRNLPRFEMEYAVKSE